jgi:hypothetical protein
VAPEIFFYRSAVKNCSKNAQGACPCEPTGAAPVRSTVHAQTRNSRASRQKLARDLSLNGTCTMIEKFNYALACTCRLKSREPLFSCRLYLLPIDCDASLCLYAPSVRSRPFAPSTGRKGRRTQSPPAQRGCLGLVRSTQTSWPLAAAHDEP